MKNCILTICKDEENFLDEWINYHLDLGFDKIFIIDNNDSLKKLNINNPKICIIPFNDIDFGTNWGSGMQIYAYNYALEYIKKTDYDYIAVIDVDEFITLNNSLYQNINDFITKEMVEKNETIAQLVWVTYTDNNIIYEKDLIDNSVLKSYTKTIPQTYILDYGRYNSFYCLAKSIVKNTPSLVFHNPHFPNNIDKTDNSISNSIYKTNFIYRGNAYIKHFRTKCLETYLKHKVKETKCNNGYTGAINNIFNFFFMHNKVTPEKLNAFENLCKKYEIEYSQNDVDMYKK